MSTEADAKVFQTPKNAELTTVGVGETNFTGKLIYFILYLY